MLIKAYHDSGSVGDSSGARPSDKVGAVSKKKIRPFRPQFGLKIAVGGGGGARGPPPPAPAGPSPGSATG